MNKQVVITAAAIAAIAGAWGGSTAYLGQQVQQRLDAQVQAWNSAPEQRPRVVRITDVKYERGWLGATRVVNVAIGCGENAATLSWQDDIRHGPLPGFAGFGAARIDSKLRLTEAQKEHWRALTGEAQPQLALRTWVSLAGAATMSLDMPVLQLRTADGGLLKMEQASAQLKLDRQGRAQYSASIPAYTFNGPMTEGPGTVRMRAQNLRWDGEGLAPLWWVFSGKGEGRIGRLEVATEQPGEPEKPILLLEDLAYTQEGAMTDGLYGARFALGGKGQIGGMALDTISMKLRMERLHGESYARFVQSIYSAECPAGNADPQAQAKEWMAGVAALLPHNPSFALEELQFSAAGQRAKLAYSGTVQGVTEADLSGPNPVLAVMKKVALNAEFEVALPMISQLANALDRPLPPDVLEQSIAQAVGKGLLVRQADRVIAKVEWKNGGALLNGKPMPLPGAPAPAPAPPNP